MSHIPESDWKYMRSIKDKLLARLCDEINAQVRATLDTPSLSAHECYLEIFRIITAGDKRIADAFDDWRRSTILWRILEISRQGLMTQDEFTGLSLETQELIQRIREVPRKR